MVKTVNPYQIQLKEKSTHQIKHCCDMKLQLVNMIIAYNLII